MWTYLPHLASSLISYIWSREDVTDCGKGGQKVRGIVG